MQVFPFFFLLQIVHNLNRFAINVSFNINNLESHIPSIPWNAGEKEFGFQ